MRNITDDADLQDCRNADGYIYNDYSPSGATGNVFHVASCPTLATANTKYAKYYAADRTAAIAWLSANRADRWRDCETCTP